MPLRFRRCLRIIRGVKLNISKTGTSLSFGGSGATVNVSKKGIFGTVGLPGTGISARERLDTPTSTSRRPSTRVAIGVLVVLAAIAWAVLQALFAW